MKDLVAADGEPRHFGGAGEARQALRSCRGREGRRRRCAMSRPLSAWTTVTRARRPGFRAARAMPPKRLQPRGDRRHQHRALFDVEDRLAAASVEPEDDPVLRPHRREDRAPAARRRHRDDRLDRCRNTALCEGGLDLPAFPREIGRARHVLERAAAADAEMAADRRHAVGARCDDYRRAAHDRRVRARPLPSRRGACRARTSARSRFRPARRRCGRGR